MGLSAACVMGVAGCSSNNQNSGSGAVAATINGTEIYEDTVTDYIQSVREQQGLTDEDSWGNYLAQMGTDPAGVREQIINTYVTRELINSGAEEKGVTVDSSEVDSYVDKMKSNYDSDEKWQSALEQAGMTEDEYRSEIELQLKAKELYNTFTSSEEPSNDDMLQYAQMYASAYDGAKRSSHILFDSDDEATAQDVLNKINSGELDFAEAAKQYSKDTGSKDAGGDVGWDKLNSFVSEYTAGLADLSKGQVSGLVTSSYGIHIIKCTDEFHAPDELTSLDQLPSEFVEQFRSSLKSSNQSKAYQQWLSDAKDNADIEIKDMPSGLPYDLDMSKYQSDDSSDSSSTDGSSGSADNEVSATDASSTSSDTASDSGDSETKKAA